MALLDEVNRERGKALGRRIEGRKIDDLAADMHVDAGDGKSGQCRGPGVDARRLVDRDAEFIGVGAGRDLGVRVGVDIGIDADRDARRRARERWQAPTTARARAPIRR